MCTILVKIVFAFENHVLHALIAIGNHKPFDIFKFVESCVEQYLPTC
jgi:hypothetical protein